MSYAGNALSGAGLYFVIAIVVLYLCFCLVVGMKSNKKTETVKEYFIANKSIGMFFLFFTCWGSFCGAGNFVGFAGSAAQNGIDAYWSYFGDAVFGYVVFSWLIAPHLAKFDYFTMPQYISHRLCGNDTYVRRIGGLAAALCNIAISGIQMRGLAYLLNTFCGLNYYLSLIVAAGVLIVYTAMGGMTAVVQTDAIQGILQVVGTILMICFGIGLMHCDIGWLTSSLREVDASLVTPFGHMSARACISGFLTGFFGDLCNPIMWNRAFIAKDSKTASKCFKLATVLGIVSTGIIMTFGLVAKVYNPEVADQATYWLVLNKMPYFMVPLMTLCFMGAIMSTADTHLNAGVANLVCDVFDPTEKMSVDKTLKISKISCFAAGGIGLLGAAVFPSILTLSFFGLTVAGATIFPVFAIGNLMRDKNSREFRSNLSIKAVRVGMTAGAVVAIFFDLVPSLAAIAGGGIIPGLVCTTVIILVCNKIFKPEYPVGGTATVENYAVHQMED